MDHTADLIEEIKYLELLIETMDDFIKEIFSLDDETYGAIVEALVRLERLKE